MSKGTYHHLKSKNNWGNLTFYVGTEVLSPETNRFVSLMYKNGTTETVKVTI